jgi:hypothetical protein
VQVRDKNIPGANNNIKADEENHRANILQIADIFLEMVKKE